MRLIRIKCWRQWENILNFMIRTKAILLFTSVLFILIGCTSPGSPVSEVLPTQQKYSSPTSTPSTISPSPISTFTLQPIANSFPGYTPQPTLPVKNEHQVAELLHFSGCKLPCYLGITPGITSISEATAILENLGANYISLDNKYDYSLIIGDPLILPIHPNRYALVYTSINLTIVNDKVQIINLGIITDQMPIALETYRKYWARYSTSSIFSELGKPDQLFTGTGDGKKSLNRELIIIYEKIGVFNHIRGSWQENNFCLKEENQEIYTTMDLFEPGAQSIEEINPYLTDSTH